MIVPGPDSRNIVNGDGYAIASLHSLAGGHGILDLRRPLDVTGFGIDVLVLKPGGGTLPHRFEHQQELYLVYRGRVCVELDDADWFVVEAGALVRVDAHAVRRVWNVGDEEAIVLALGGAEGYVAERRPALCHQPGSVGLAAA